MITAGSDMVVMMDDGSRIEMSDRTELAVAKRRDGSTVRLGGGAIIVPVLYEVFRLSHVHEDIRIQLCVGTSLAIIVPTSIRSFQAHRARGNLPVEILRIWAVPVIVGVITGGIIAALAPSALFKLAFVVITAIIGAKFLFARAHQIDAAFQRTTIDDDANAVAVLKFAERATG